MNVLFGALSFLILTFGVMLNTSVMFTDGIIPLVIGSYLFVTAFCGFWGSVFEMRCWTIWYSGFLSLLLAFQIGAGITGLVKQDELVEIAHNIGMDTIDYWQDPEVQWAWTEMQVDLNCCGIDSYKDWSKTVGDSSPSEQSFLQWAETEGWNPDGESNKNTSYPVPDSCCVNYGNYDMEYCGLEYNFSNVTDALRPMGDNVGCAERVGELVTQSIPFIIGITVGFLAIQLICLNFAIYLLSAKNGYVRFQNPIDS